MLFKYYLFALIKKQKLIFFCMVIMSSLTFSLYIGSDYALHNYNKSVDNYFNDCKHPSAFVNTDITKASIYDCLQDVDGVKDYDVRFTSLYSFCFDANYYNVVLNTYKSDDFSKFAYMSEYVSSSNIGIFVDKCFADHHNIKAGDTVSVGRKGKFCDCTVNQIILKPENYFIQVFDEAVIDNIDYGAIYINQKDFNKFLNTIGQESFDTVSNQVLLDIDSSDMQNVLDNCCSVLSSNVNIKSSFLDSDTPAYQLREAFTNQTTTVSAAIPIAFLIIMSLVFIMFLIQIIKRQSREIGILLAAGYQKRSLYLLFAIYTFTISVLSIIIGFLLSIVTGEINYSVIKEGFYIPVWTEDIFADNFLLIVLLIILSGQIACVISSLAFRNSTPMDAIESNYQKYFYFNKSIEKLLSKIPIIPQLTFNSIVQNLRSFLVLVFGLIASFVMIHMALSIYFSMQEYITYTYDFQNNYDAQIVCLQNQDESEFNELKSNDNITNLEVLNYFTADIRYGDNSVNSFVVDKSIQSDMININDAYSGQNISVPEEGIIIDKLTADKLKIKPGCYVEIFDQKLEVKAISAMYVNPYEIVSTNQMKQLNTTKFKDALVNMSSKEKLQEFCAYSQNELYPIITKNLKQMQIDWKGPINIIIEIIVLAAILLGFIVACVINKMVLEKQKRVISILRCQGMHMLDISIFWSLQMGFQLILAFIIGLPIANFIGGEFVNMLSTDTSYYPYINSFQIYLISFTFVVLFVMLSQAVIVFTISKYKIAKNVQSRE